MLLELDFTSHSTVDITLISLGETVGVGCDGCPANLTARISFIARTAEFTPPVIYSLEERSKLVYRIRIAVDNSDGVLKQGMPVEAELRIP